MRLLKGFCVLTLGLAIPLAMSSVVRADAVTDWNAFAVQTIVNAGPTHGSAVSFLDNATVQIAVYDAVDRRSIQTVPRTHPRGVGLVGGRSRQGFGGRRAFRTEELSS
jgi:hypothetical protein